MALPNDRVVAYLPNVPEAMVALCACAAIGAIWASCSPDFGAEGVLDRVRQLAPKVLLAVDGYRYGGKVFDRRGQVRQIARELDSIEQVIVLPMMFPDESLTLDKAIDWRELQAFEVGISKCGSGLAREGAVSVTEFID